MKALRTLRNIALSSLIWLTIKTLLVRRLMPHKPAIQSVERRWIPMRDRKNNLLFVPHDLIEAAIEAEHTNAASSKNIEPYTFGPYTPEELRRVILIAFEEHDPDIAIVSIAANSDWGDG